MSQPVGIMAVEQAEGPQQPAPAREAVGDPAADAALLEALAGLGEDDTDPEGEPETAEPDEAEQVDDDQATEPEVAQTAPATTPDESVDPETSKRLAMIQQREEQARRAVAKEREAWEAERKAFEPRIKAVEDYEAIKVKARHDPAAVLEALGWTADELELAARQIYYRSSAAKDNPEQRAEVERQMRHRQHDSELDKVKAELQEIKAREHQRQSAAEEQRMLSDYVDGITKAVGDSAPAVKRLMSKDANAAQRAMLEIAQILNARDGVAPSAAEVVAELEKRQRAQLALYLDPAQVEEVLKGAKQNPGNAAKTKPASSRTLSNDLRAPTAPRSEPKSEAELDEEVLAGLAAL